MAKNPPKRPVAKRTAPKTTVRQRMRVAPGGVARVRSISAPDAHMMTATSTVFMTQPKYICVPSGPPPAPCLRYGLDPATGEYGIPPFGEEMDCATCKASR